MLTRLLACWPSDFPPPLLLMDRGFDKGPLLRWLLKMNCLFIVRAKRNRFFDRERRVINGKLCSLHGSPCCFPNITYTARNHHPLHLVLATKAVPAGQNWTGWCLLTTLPEDQLRRAPALYALRMTPEQTHRDSKRGATVSGFALGHLAKLRLDRLERLVFLASLAYSFLVLLGHVLLEYCGIRLKNVPRVHAKVYHLSPAEKCTTSNRLPAAARRWKEPGGGHIGAVAEDQAS